MEGAAAQAKTYGDGDAFLEPVDSKVELTLKNRSDNEAATVLLYQVVRRMPVP